MVIRHRLRPTVLIAVAIVVLQLLAVTTAHAATPRLLAAQAGTPEAGAATTLTWRIADGIGATTWITWDTRSVSQGAHRNVSTRQAIDSTRADFSARVTVPAGAQRLYFSVAIRVDGQVLAFKERSAAVTPQMRFASSYEEAGEAVALVVVSDRNGNPISSGTAFIVGRDRLLTNEHVIAGAYSVTVIYQNGTRAEATVQGYDRNLDVAALAAKTPAGAYRLEWDISGRERVGTDVWAWGYPGETLRVFGLSATPTLTSGIISSFQSLDGVTYAQTTADIHGGNSGGPLVTSSGRVVGINTASLIDRATGGSLSGMNLAISVPDHRGLVRGVIGGAEAGPPRASREPDVVISNMRLSALQGDTCNTATPLSSVRAMDGLCVSASYPAALLGRTVQIEWTSNGRRICGYASVVSSNVLSGGSLFSCRIQGISSGAYSVSISYDGVVLGRHSETVTIILVNDEMVLDYIRVETEQWNTHMAQISAYTTLWNGAVATEWLPSVTLSGYAQAQATSAQSMVRALTALRGHGALADPAVLAMHQAGEAYWSASVTYFSQLAYYALGAPWPTSSVTLRQIRFAEYMSAECQVRSKWSLGSC